MDASKSPAATVLPDVDWKIGGTIEAVLTMNLSESAFEDDRQHYWSVRGGKEMAKWLRSLAQDGRIPNAHSPFRSDDDGAELEALGYGANLLSQYVVDQEFMPTYELKGDQAPVFAFGADSDDLFAAFQREAGGCEKGRAGVKQLRELLEKEASRRLAAAWRDWSVKRVRLCRYGVIQVVLALTRTAGNPVDFVGPVARLGGSLGPTGLAADLQAARGANPDPLLDSFLALKIVKRRAIESSVQWEIVMQILGWIRDSVNENRRADDLLRFCATYPDWTHRRAHTGGRDLPFRRRFLLFRIDRLEHSVGGPVTLDSKVRRELAMLLDETPLVLENGASRFAPQREDYLKHLSRDDRSTWRQETCLITHNGAVLVGLHDPNLLLNLDRDIKYHQYWEIVARGLAYLCELRLIARLLEHKVSLRLEKTARVMANKRFTDETLDTEIKFNAAATVLMLRIENSSSPTAISPTEAVVAKLACLRQHFGLSEVVDRTGGNLAASQRTLAHYQRLGAQMKMVDLHVGLAAFTGILMGLTLPTFMKDVFFADHLEGRLPAEIIGALWVLGGLWVVLTVAAIGRAIWEVKTRLKDSTYAVWLRQLRHRRAGGGVPKHA